MRPRGRTSPGRAPRIFRGGIAAVIGASLLTLTVTCRPYRETAAFVPTEAVVPESCLDAECHLYLLQGTVVHEPVADGFCLNCHMPADPVEHEFTLIREGSELCADCHEVDTEIENAQSVHEPVRRGDCGACHDPHRSEYRGLLVKRYDPRWFGPWDERRLALCFSCHDRNLVNEAETTIATAFRNGERNLHTVHIQREKGGSCRVCHRAHASAEKHLYRELDGLCFTVGSWEMPNLWSPRPNGGRCAPGCHVIYEYDRVDAIDYSAARMP